MASQLSLEMKPIPVRKVEKVSVKTVWSSEFYSISLSEKEFDNIMSGDIRKPLEEYLVQKMKVISPIPISKMGVVYHHEFKKLKSAIMNEPIEPDIEKITRTLEPEENKILEEKEPEKDKTIEIIQNLMTKDEDITEYLINNFKQPEINAIAIKLHIKVDTLPQKTAWKIGEKIKGLREKRIKDTR
jgi:hypothetical protein